MAATEGINWLVLGHRQVANGNDRPRGRSPQLKLLLEPVEFRLLGQVEVLRGRERLALGGHRQLAVLTVLVMNAGRMVSVDHLVDALWGEAPPPAARATVHAYVSKVRRVLDPGARSRAVCSLLATRGRGYIVEVDPDSVDAQRFQRLAAEGRLALASGRAEMAVRLFADALALWRGPALANFASESFAAAEIARLEELRLSVIEDQVEAALTLGQHRELVADLERLVAAHPFRERLRGQLMVALYRSGRQAEALGTYQAGRQLLAEELGIDPSPTLKTLERAMLRQDASLNWAAPGPPARPAGSEGRTRSPEALTFLSSRIGGLMRPREAHPERAVLLEARHEDIVTQVVVALGGSLSDDGTEGDVVAVFSHASDALTAAITLQRTLAAEHWPDGITVEVRIGLRTRDVAAADAAAHTALAAHRPKVGVA